MVRDIVDNNDAVGATVVRGCDGAETLLSGGIPLLDRFINKELRISGWVTLKDKNDTLSKSSTYNLKLDGLALELDGADFLNSGKMVERRRRLLWGFDSRDPDIPTTEVSFAVHENSAM